MPSFDELIASAPTVTGKSITYLGVPEGYKAQRPDIQGPASATSDPRQIAPRYAEGSQYDPHGLSPEVRAQMQVQLDSAGLYDKGDTIRLGVWDDTTVAAYTKLLKFANQGGYDVPTALQQLGTLTAAERAERGLGSVGKGGAGGSSRQPLVVSLSNPTDLRALVRRTAQKTLGQGISEEQMNHFVGAYQQLERQYQQQAYEQAGAAGGTVIEAPSVEAFAEQQVEAADPVAAEATRQVNVFKTVANALRGMKG